MIPERLRGLCDDAAIFPPGLLPLAEAVRAHREHQRSEYAELVGPLVLSVAALDALPPLVAELAAGELQVSLTVPAPAALAPALDQVAALPAVHVVAVEVALPPDTDVASALARLDATPQAYVEIPRDDRRPAVLELLAGGPHRAKFRTGGVQGHLYPDERELAEAIAATARLGLAFKATAGLHHAIRNSDPVTGFEQHGFLNVLLATEAARQGADVTHLVDLLADRDGARIAETVAGLTPERAADARTGFTSFGTCSISDPLSDLLGLGLLGRADPDREGES